jgi:NADH:ubiquinone oxidoreductase subunit F (NADH-binding)
MWDDFCYDDSNCVIDIVKNVLEFFSKESCGKWAPCREGSVQMVKLITKICTRQR